MDQLLLFAPPHRPSTIAPRQLVHHTDGETSREAARKLVESGKLARQQQEVYDALRQHDGSTHGELGEAMAIHWLIPARRLPELEKLSLVHKGEPRTCKVKGSKCVTWWVLERDNV